MPSYNYKALNAQRQEVSGTIDGVNEKSVTARLREMGLRPFEIVEQKESKGMSFSFGKKTKIKSEHLTTFTRQLATLLDAGLPLLRALAILVEQSATPALSELVEHIRTDIHGGASFSESLAKHPKVFNKLYVSMIKAGEIGGVLEVVLERLADFAEKDEALKAKIKSAMTYPVIMIVVASVVVTILMLTVIPSFAQLFSKMKVKLPLPTQVLIFASNAMKNYWYLIFGSIAATIIGLKKYVQTDAGKKQWDTYRLKIPIFGDLQLKVIVSRFARTLGTLLQSGVPILQALEIVRDTAGNVMIEESINKVITSVSEGEGVAPPLHREAIFPSMVTNMIAVGEETGALDSMLMKIADNYDMVVDETVKGLTSMLEPILIVSMGIIVGFVVAALFMPMFQLVDVVG